jgi:phosphate transport system substrate-binding protein
MTTVAHPAQRLVCASELGAASRRAARPRINRRWRLAALVAMLVSAAPTFANAAELPAYEPEPVTVPGGAGYVSTDGAIVVVGYNDMQGMLERWAALFERAHAGVAFSLRLKGTRTAPPALARGESAFAPMGAEFSPEELADYRARRGADPVMIRVAHASLDPRALSGPIGIFVHRSNPLASLTTQQVAEIFTGGHATTWGALGRHDAAADKTVHPCGLARDTALGIFMRGHHFGGRELGPGFAGFPQSADVVRRVGEDPFAIGFAAANRGSADVKLLAIAPSADTPPVPCTNENLMAGRYAYDRHLLIYARRDASHAVEAFAREFLRLVLSRDGQQAIAADSLGYLPLSATEAAEELAKLPQPRSFRSP